MKLKKLDIIGIGRRYDTFLSSCFEAEKQEKATVHQAGMIRNLIM